MRNFDSVPEREIRALAIALKKEDERIYTDFADGLRQGFPASAALFEGMRDEESGHRRRLIELFREKFGHHMPLLRRNYVRGFVHRTPVGLIRPLGLETVRNQASAMEVETRRFYEKAAAQAPDARVRQWLDDLAQEERSHEDRAEELEHDKLRPEVKRNEDEASRRLFVLQIVQPGLAGLMDGSVSTLANAAFLGVLDRDARDSFAAMELVLAQPAISSQFIDNLNASMHLRALLTDTFLFGEVLRTQRAAANQAVGGRASADIFASELMQSATEAPVIDSSKAGTVPRGDRQFCELAAGLHRLQ